MQPRKAAGINMPVILGPSCPHWASMRLNADIGMLERQVRPLIAAGRLVEAEALVRPRLASGSGPLAQWHLLVDAIRPQGRIAETLAIQEMLVATVPGD